MDSRLKRFKEKEENPRKNGMACFLSWCDGGDGKYEKKRTSVLNVGVGHG